MNERKKLFLISCLNIRSSTFHLRFIYVFLTTTLTTWRFNGALIIIVIVITNHNSQNGTGLHKKKKSNFVVFMYTDIAVAGTVLTGAPTYPYGRNFSKSFWPRNETIEIRKNIYFFYTLWRRRQNWCVCFVHFTREYFIHTREHERIDMCMSRGDVLFSFWRYGFYVFLFF